MPCGIRRFLLHSPGTAVCIIDALKYDAAGHLWHNEADNVASCENAEANSAFKAARQSKQN